MTFFIFSQILPDYGRTAPIFHFCCTFRVMYANVAKRIKEAEAAGHFVRFHNQNQSETQKGNRNMRFTQY